MATNTYVALDKVTVGSAVASVTFSSINQGYTDLVLAISGTADVASNVGLRFNSDSGTNYSCTLLYGDGTTAASERVSNTTYFNCGGIASATQSNSIINIMNYSNATTYKTALGRGNRPGDQVNAKVALWRSTSAITSMSITPINGGSVWSSGTTFSLYGIRAEGTSPAPKATGGAIYSDSTYYYHVFGSTGTFTPSVSLTADVLVVAGGGSALVGGGGAGGLRAISGISCTTTGYTITVGAGGVSSTGYPYYYSANGTNSSALSYSATGGGGSGLTDNSPGAGYSGGSGGGGAGDGARTNAGGSGNAGSYSPVEGYAGGASISTSAPYVGGGGGGAGGVGQTAPAYNNPGNGGIGATSSLINAIGVATGSGQLSGGNYYFAGGGAGGTADSLAGSPTQATGGLGGGGNTAPNSTTYGRNGTVNTGGGGGGRYGNSGASSIGGSGGSGVVIVRYLKA